MRILMTEEGLKAIQPKAFKPKTTDSKGVSAAPNLLANIKIEECAPGKIIIGDITYIRLRGGRVLLLGNVAGQGHQKDHGVEFGWGNDGGISHFSVAESYWQRIAQSRSDSAFGSRQPIRFGRISPSIATELFPAKYERQRKLLR